MKGIKFILQRDEWSCGPIALMNTLKALNRKVIYRDIHKYRKMLGWKYKDGVWPESIEKVLKRLKIKYFKRVEKKVTLGFIDKYLKKGYFCILLFAWNKDESHYILITDRNIV